ncbi:heavy metal translocating P-type ATPase [Helicobacter muridarum]|uniref:Copper-transporting ATPase n=1 Tax=Helicobacter muridarum TaxID=216 RepID=A0A377PX59_9HELI|nr:heavy metal translocating P-type ATPase [Helicobacter muridarum]TLE00006.1 heavy metal translocating P-type ATPase [Helicobacter muridarum]STQ87079.1 putative copper-transporting P-type ATPase [Helicobacter muridarum]
MNSNAKLSNKSNNINTTSQTFQQATTKDSQNILFKVPSLKIQTTKDIKSDNEESLRLRIEGMSCASCAASIERSLQKINGIIESNIFILTHSGVVRFNPSQCSTNDIIQSIEQLGFKAFVDSKPAFSVGKANLIKTNILQPQPILKPKLSSITSNEKPTNTNGTTKNKISNIANFIENKLLNNKRRLVLSLILSIIILYISMFYEMFGLPLFAPLDKPLYNALTQLIITLAVMHFGRAFYFRGLKALFALRPNMDSLVSLGSLAGFFYSLYSLLLIALGETSWHLYFESVCVILSFVMLGKYIEDNVKSKAMGNATSLLQTQQTIARKILNIKEISDISQNLKIKANKDKVRIQEVLVDALQIGDYIQILPQSIIPLDCSLYSMSANIDESLLSGESLPVMKEKNSILLGGSMNLDSMIIAKVCARQKDSAISKMQALIAQTYESKANIAKLADKISSFFVPAVIMLASLSAIFWLIKSDMQTAMLYFTSTLLISCPCALGLATPMAILFANSRANKNGVFFKNSQSIENLAKIDYIIFDKTGTLTHGDFLLHSITSRLDSINQEELLRIAASIEQGSNHIIAKAITKAARDMELYNNEATNTINNIGLESRLRIDSKQREFLIGNAKVLQDRGNITLEELQNIESLQDNRYEKSEEYGLINIYIAEKKQDGYELLGYISLQENLRQDAKEMIQRLKNRGFNCEILSGDKDSSVANIANILDIPYRANCLPQDKMQHIKSLQDNGHKVMMIGDGINDAIAIAKADVSLVMASGHEISIEYGDIIYFRKDLLGIVDSLYLGHATLNNIKQNLGFAFIYNVICIPIAMGAFSGFGITLNPMLASIAMSLSSISVVGNASRLYGIKRV